MADPPRTLSGRVSFLERTMFTMCKRIIRLVYRMDRLEKIVNGGRLIEDGD